MSTRWPTPLKEVRKRHPTGPVVQMRVTFERGTSVSYDGVATSAVMKALFDIIIAGTPDPAMRKILDLMKGDGEETLKRSKVAANMSTIDIVAEWKQLAKQWDESRSNDDDDAGHGGSPGEWMVERMGELEQELKNRGADQLIADATPPKQVQP